MSDPFSIRDRLAMRRAFASAKVQVGRTGKNPAVGCVLVHASGRVLSDGVTCDGGHDHAEARALRALSNGKDSIGATAYVTLEPCRERSAGGVSCSTLLSEAGIVRVVCPIEDKHPNGAGGFDRLRAGGVTVETGLMADEASALYADFFAQIK